MRFLIACFSFSFLSCYCPMSSFASVIPMSCYLPKECMDTSVIDVIMPLRILASVVIGSTFYLSSVFHSHTIKVVIVLFVSVLMPQSFHQRPRILFWSNGCRHIEGCHSKSHVNIYIYVNQQCYQLSGNSAAYRPPFWVISWSSCKIKFTFYTFERIYLDILYCIYCDQTEPEPEAESRMQVLSFLRFKSYWPSNLAIEQTKGTVEEP